MCIPIHVPPLRARRIFLLSGVAALLPLIGGAQTRDNPPVLETVELSPFEISAEKDDGYAATNSLSGTKIATPLRDLPLSMEIVTEDFIEDIAAFDFVETLQYSTAASIDETSGVSATVRGFSSTFNFRNGFRYYARRDSANIQRVEVVKGPAALLYGNVQPGGVVNVLTKRPTNRNTLRVNASATSFGGERVTLDVNRKVSSKVSARLNAAYSVNPTYRDFTDSTFKLLAPVISWKPTSRTTVLLDFEIARVTQQAPSMLNQARNNVPIYASVEEGGLGIPTTVNWRGPDGELEDNVNNYFGVVEHTFSDELSLRLGFNIHDRVTYPFRPEAFSLVNAPANNPSGVPAGTLSQRYNWQRNEFDNFLQSYSADIVWRPTLFGVTNQILAGATVQNDVFIGRRYRDLLPNLQNRFYYLPLNDLSVVAQRPADLELSPVPNQGTPREENTTVQYYVTHQLRLFENRFITLAGVYLTQIDNYETSLSGSLAAPTVVSSRYDADEVKPQAGFIVRPIEPLSFFALYATSIYPQAGADARDGFDNPFAPVEGESREIGLKFDLWGDKLVGAVSGYEIIENGRVVNDPDAPNKDSVDRNGLTPFDPGFDPTNLDPAFPIGARRQVGETTSQGVDIDLLFRPTARWQSKIGYSYLDFFISEDLDPTQVGRTNNGVAKHRFSA